MSYSSLPVIDLESNADVIQQSLLHACSTTGFFYLSKHHLNSTQNRMFSMAKEFFHLPLDEKRVYALNTITYQGYLQIGQENLDSTSSQLTDAKEAFKIRQSNLNNPDELPDIFTRPENFQTIDTFFRACYDLCIRLFEHLANTFEVDQDYFTSKHQWDKPPGATLKLLHYPSTNKTIKDVNTIRAVRLVQFIYVILYYCV